MGRESCHHTPCLPVSDGVSARAASSTRRYRSIFIRFGAEAGNFQRPRRNSQRSCELTSYDGPGAPGYPERRLGIRDRTISGPIGSRGGLLRPALSYHFWHVYRRICCITADRIPHFAASYRFSAVWDGDKLQKNACVSIRGDKIESVGACPVGAIDLSRYTAIPGMIDVHTHLTYVHQNPVSEA